MKKLFKAIKSIFSKNESENVNETLSEEKCTCKSCECNACSCEEDNITDYNETLENIFNNSKSRIPNKYFMKNCIVTNHKISEAATIKGFYFAPSRGTYFFAVYDRFGNKHNWYLPKKIENLTLKFSDVYENDFFKKSIKEIYDENGLIHF